MFDNASYPSTALSISCDIGLRQSRTCLTGAAIAEMNDAALCRAVGEFDVFARVVPMQRLRLVIA